MNRQMKDSGFHWLGKIPNTWKLERLDWHLTELKENNKPVKSTNILSLTNKLGVVPYSKKGNQGNVAKDDYSQYKLAYPDTIVANSMNILIGSVGKCSYFGCVSPVYYVFKPNDSENLDYFNYIFQLEQFQKELRRYANGILEIRLRVSSSDILKRFVMIPPKNEQEKIVNFLNMKCNQIDLLIKNQEKQIENLKAYKQSLITEVVTNGLNPNVEMKDSTFDCIGSIPKKWSICRLRNIGFPQNGVNKSGENFGSGYPFVSYSDVYKNISLPYKVEGLVQSTEQERKKYSVKEGDIFFTRTSETIEEVGFSSVCEKTIPNATFAGFLIRVRPYSNMIYKGFAKYYFRGNHLRNFLVKEMNLVTRASLGQNLLKNIPILLPDKKEQVLISEYLDKKCFEINKLITIKQVKIEKLNEYKKSIIYEYVTGKKEVI